VGNQLKEERVGKEVNVGFVEYWSNLTKKVRPNFELIYVGSNRIRIDEINSTGSVGALDWYSCSKLVE
jgi:hypothetical protein